MIPPSWEQVEMTRQVFNGDGLVRRPGTQTSARLMIAIAIIDKTSNTNGKQLGLVRRTTLEIPR